MSDIRTKEERRREGEAYYAKIAPRVESRLAAQQEAAERLRAPGRLDFIPMVQRLKRKFRKQQGEGHDG